MAQPFIPRDKPKSWVIFICAGLIGLLVFGPVLFLGAIFEISLVWYLGSTGFVACAVAMVLSWVVFMLGMLTGRYRNLPAREWKDQVW